MCLSWRYREGGSSGGRGRARASADKARQEQVAAREAERLKAKLAQLLAKRRRPAKGIPLHMLAAEGTADW